jgi:hypothetical protein
MYYVFKTDACPNIRAGLRIWFLLLPVVLFLSGCGGGGNSGDAGSGNGEVVISLTDAQGDFVTYTVDVESILLTRADGTEVETLPLSTRVDFAQYTTVSEFLIAATVPNGRYIRGRMVLDYGNADIQVENTEGDAQPVNTILDGNGDPVTTLEIEVSLEGRHVLPVAPGIPKNLTLDFDLYQSNTVTFDGDEVTVSVDPVLIAEVDPDLPKVHRLRGPLQSVSVEEGRFRLFIRPFFHPIRTGPRRFGGLTVTTSDETFYEIDGISYQGEPGLSVLDTLALFSAVSVRGELRFDPLRFDAREVYAGSSVPGGTLDVVRGTVTERTPDDVITVRGATLIRQDGVVVFNDSVTVQLDDSTTVTKQLSTDSHDIDDISVGQRITVFGTVTNDSVSDLQFSAANGYVRMRLATIRGSVAALPATDSWLAMDLESVNNRSIELYDFGGTGSGPTNEAERNFYEIDTGSLRLEAVGVADDLVITGFPTRFGSAPPDFTAQTVAR